MPTPLQHPSLIVGVLYLLHLHDLCFLQHLHCVETLVVLRLGEMHTPEGAGSERTLEVEVGQRVFALRLTHGVGGCFSCLDAEVRCVAIV